MKLAQDIIRDLLAAEPKFIHKLRIDVDLWLHENGDISLCMIFTSLTEFVLDDLAKDHQYEYKKLFGLIETYIDGDQEDLADAAATCFVDNLQNASSIVDPELWIPYAGQKTREYARAWDEFTGVKTKGLYDV
jgi:hypothetical protein